jgi:Pretoxin HINT domain
VGDPLTQHEGLPVPVEAVSEVREIATVYNLRVADYHTYFVGCKAWGFSVWAHNAEYAVVPHPSGSGLALAELQPDGRFFYVQDTSGAVRSFATDADAVAGFTSLGGTRFTGTVGDLEYASVSVVGKFFANDPVLADVQRRFPKYVIQDGQLGQIRSGRFTPLSRYGDFKTFVGRYRVSQVIQKVGLSEVVNESLPISTGLGATDIDLVLQGKRYIEIGGDKSGPQLESQLKKLLEYAQANGGTVQFMYDPAATRGVAIATAKTLLGDANVIPIH